LSTGHADGGVFELVSDKRTSHVTLEDVFETRLKDEDVFETRCFMFFHALRLPGSLDTSLVPGSAWKNMTQVPGSSAWKNMTQSLVTLRLDSRRTDPTRQIKHADTVIER